MKRLSRGIFPLLAILVLGLAACRSLFSPEPAQKTGAARAWTLKNRHLSAEVSFDKEVKIGMIKFAADGVEFQRRPGALFTVNSCREYLLARADQPGPDRLLLSLTSGRNPNIGAELELAIKDKSLTASLKVLNSSRDGDQASVVFPSVESVSLGRKAADLWYFAPCFGGVVNNANILLEGPCGESFPMQFFDVYNPVSKKGLFMGVSDDKSLHKVFSFKKDSSVSLRVSYPLVEVPASGSIQMPSFEMRLHDGDWHEAANIYRSRNEGLTRKFSPARSWVSKIFSYERIYNFNKKELDEAEKWFGGTEFAADSGAWWWGRNDRYWEGLGDYEITFNEKLLAENMDKFRKSGAKSGVFFSPGLVWTGSRLYKTMREMDKNWLALNREGKEMSHQNEPVWRACLGASEYRAAFVETVSRNHEKLKFDFMQLEGVGVSSEAVNVCHNDTHWHPVPCPSPLGFQAALVGDLRKSLPDNVAIFTEFSGGEALAPLVDGAVSRCFLENSEKSLFPVDVLRFVFPGVRFFAAMPYQQLREEKNPSRHLDMALFNGEGFFTQRPSRWQNSESGKALLERMRVVNQILSESWEEFSSERPEPLVETLRPGVLANRFPSERRVVYTLLNLGAEEVSGDILAVREKAAVEKAEGLGGKKGVRISGGNVSLSLKPGEVAAVRLTFSEPLGKGGEWRSWGTPVQREVFNSKTKAQFDDGEPD